MEREKIKLKALDYIGIICPFVLETEVDSFSFDEQYEDHFDFDEEEYLGTYELWEKFETIDEEVSLISLEDSYIKTRVVVRRLDDNKYFEGEYCEIYGELITDVNDRPLYELTEVFPKIIEKTIFI